MSRELARRYESTATSRDRDDDDDQLDPGRRSRSELLRKPSFAVASGLVHRKARDANGVADGAERAVAAASSSSGMSLPDHLMRKFESSLGADLSGVRVHTGEVSAAANDAVGAKAYTMGSDIHFAVGQYDPSSADGEHLLAHEVAHTVQQGGGAQRMQFKLAVSSPGDAMEHEADRAADAMMSGLPAAVTFGTGVARLVMRQEKPAKGAGKATWVAPYDLGTASKRSEARVGVERVYDMLLDAKGKLDATDASQAAMADALDPHIDALVGCVKAIPKDGDLEAGDIATINKAVSAAVSTFDAHAVALGAKVKAAAAKLAAERSVIEDAAAEKLHAMYTAGTTTDEKSGETVAMAKKAYGLIKSINGNAVTIASLWGEPWALALKHPTPVTFASTYLKPVGTAFKYLDTATDALSTLIGLVKNPGKGDLQAIASLKVGLAAVSVASTFLKAVPVVGSLWGQFYRPAAEHCFQYIAKQMSMESSQGKEVALLEWMKQPRQPGVAPKIDPTVVKYFPGGQPVLDALYAAVNGGAPVITSSARASLMAEKSWFNNGLGAGNTLEDEMSDTKLRSWVQFNGDMVWSALYGSMPKSLS